MREWTPQAAARLARQQFGNYTAQLERTRDMDIAEGLDATLRNLRLSLRALAKSPAFSITVVLTLALGIGANSAVFSAINSVLLRPLPFPNSDRIVSIAQIQDKTPQPHIAPARLEDWNRMNHTFEAISGYFTQDDSELSGDLPEKLTHAFVSPRFLQVWGIAPQLGRDFNPAGGTLRRPQRHPDQRPVLAAALRRQSRCHRQDPAAGTALRSRSSV